MEFCVTLYILFHWSGRLLSTLSWCSAYISVSEGVFLMYPWREMYSTSTYSSTMLSNLYSFLSMRSKTESSLPMKVPMNSVKMLNYFLFSHSFFLPSLLGTSQTTTASPGLSLDSHSCFWNLELLSDSWLAPQ